MELVNRNKAVYRVSSVTVERLTPEEKKSSGYSFKAIFDNDPFSITRCSTVVMHESPDGEIYIRTIADAKGTHLEIWE